MNSGIQDADNLAWKLALTLSGQAGPGLLETYHQERHAAARENLRVTEQTIRFMVPPNWARRQARRVLLRLCSPLKSARRHVNSGKMTEPYVYADSPIVQRAGSGAVAGSQPPLGGFAPDGPVSEPGLPGRLRQIFGAGFVGLYFAAGQQDAARFAEQAAGLPWQAPARLVVVLPQGAQDPPPGSVPPGSRSAGAAVIRDQAGALAAAYGGTGPRWWLIRPDGHLAATGGPDQGPEFAAALSRAAAGPPDPDRAGTRQAEAVS
jgi:3-(3-hydroxy-phenyl)propionate hydroxylase